MSPVTEIERVVKIIRQVNDYIRVYDWEGLDNFIYTFNMVEAYPTELIGLIRSTYPVREKLDRWHNVLLAISVELVERGYDSDEMMKGLLDDYEYRVRQG